MRFVAAALAALAVALLAQAASAATVALWHMDETSGSTMVDSVGSSDGTLKNVAVDQNGFLKRAYGFNGSSSIVKVPSSATFNPGSADFSFTVRVKFSKLPADDYDLLRKGLSSTKGGHYKGEILPTGKAMCHYKGSKASRTKTAGPNLADGAWHTITCSKKASSITLIVDGVSYQKSVSIGAISNKAVLTIGAKSSGGDWYDGLMDEVSFRK